MKNKKRIFFIGIGGMGMSNLALLAKQLGYQVFGSDINKSDKLKELKDKGIKIFIGHSQKNIQEAQPKEVVYSSAIPSDNVEKLYAEKLELPVYHRFAFLTKIINKARSIGISGTHGKTTTTTMVGFILQKANFPVYTYLGGQSKLIKNSKISPATYCVIETDESDQSFLQLDPKIAIVTNVDRDHLIAYNGCFGNLKKAFRQFIMGGSNRVCNILCKDDRYLNYLIKTLNSRKIKTYSFKNQTADLFAKNIQISSQGIKADLIFHQKPIGQLNLPCLGKQNLLNSLAAILAAYYLGVPSKKSLKILSSFQLPQRRLERKGEIQGILVIDDHADHPTEIMTTLESLKPLARRIIAVYEPHRYSRMKIVKSYVGRAFRDADMIICLPLCPAFEKPIKGINSQAIYHWIKKANFNKPVYYVKDLSLAPQFLIEKAKKGDVIITLGPSTIDGLADKIISQLKNLN